MEPDVIADIPIPVPKDRKLIESIGNSVIQAIDKLENSISLEDIAKNMMKESFE